MKNDKPQCPECGSKRVWKDGIRRTKNGDVQRWLCRECGYRFSEPNVKVDVTIQPGKLLHSGANLAKQMISRAETPPQKSLDSSLLFRSENIRPQGSKPQFITKVGKSLNIFPHYSSEHRVCASKTKAAKNLVEVESQTEKRAAGATKLFGDVKSKLFEFAWWMKKEGYAESTIATRTKILKILAKRGANLFDEESVKEAIAKQNWSEGRKENAVDAYTSLLQMHGITWIPPRYQRKRKLPFIPLEKELDDLIAGCGSKTSTFLQLLKETGMRAGEAWQTEWTDIDFVGKTVRITAEKRSNPRIFRVSDKLLAMLNNLPRKPNRVFGSYPIRGFARSFQRQRKRIVGKLQNPRLMQISFHTFRHWKATTEYHKTKDILYVMKLLGHRSIKNTLIYTQLVEFQESDEFISKVATTIEEACKLVEAGFEYVCEMDETRIFRKRK